MSESKGIDWGGTPGPWHVDGLMVAPNHAVSICAMVEFDSFGGHHEAPNWKANARAIAEVPAMVRALREAREALHFHYVEWDGEPEDAVPLQEARGKIDAILARLDGARREQGRLSAR